MTEDNEIKDFGTRRPGMNVPEHYFDDFQLKMEQLIDAEIGQTESEQKLAPKISLWSQVKPWLYMAAMFISFVVVFRVFIHTDEKNDSSVVLSNNDDEQVLFDDALVASVSDYDLYESLYANAD